MAFVVRRPCIFSAIKQLPKNSATARALHSKPGSPFTSKQNPSIAAFAKSRNAFQNVFRRNYTPQGSQVSMPSGGNLSQRLLYGAAIVGGTVVATNMLFNRETREDGGMPPYERSFLNETFAHTGLGIGMIAVAAQALNRSGWSIRLMAANPWVVLGAGLACSIGTMYGTFATSPDNYVQKYAIWSAFNVTQAAVLAPLMLMQPALLMKAGLYTVGMMGSIAFVGATAKQEKYLYIGGPLLAGVAIVAISGLSPLILPATAARTLMWTERIWLYGGLAVFGGFTLYDTQKILQHARLSERGLIQKDVVNESISLELDFLNIFIRMVQILGMRNQGKR